MSTHISPDRSARPTESTPRRGNAGARNFSRLKNRVLDAGLLRRRRGYYLGVIMLLSLLLAGAVTGFVLLGDSWFQLLIAAALGIILTQFAFLTHEASHGQVLETGPAASWPTRSWGSATSGG